jgi:hypothetical protein
MTNGGVVLFEHTHKTTFSLSLQYSLSGKGFEEKNF